MLEWLDCFCFCWGRTISCFFFCGQIREERRRERERERRLEAKDAHGSKKSKITRDRDRDVGEKVRGC